MMQKLVCDVEIQTDHLISARRPDEVIINKKHINMYVNYVCPGYPLSKIERKWKER